jgi:hypothetical protein
LSFGLRVLSVHDSKPVTQNSKPQKVRKIIITVIKKALNEDIFMGKTLLRSEILMIIVTYIIRLDDFSVKNIGCHHFLIKFVTNRSLGFK